MRTLLMVVAAASIALAARPAEACTPFTNYGFSVEPGRDGDVTPPGAVTVVESSLTRGPEQPTTCGYEGILSLRLTATDDMSDVGFRVTAVRGTFEPALTGEPMQRGLLPELVFYLWELEPVYELDVSAVDRAGNVGPSTRLTFTAPPGSDDGGCAAGGGGGGAGGAFALLGLGLLVARRRR